jgi:putative flippase GtrA
MPLLNNFYQKLGWVTKKFFPKLYCRFFEKTSFAKFFISGSIAGSIDLIFLYLFHGIFHWGIVISTSAAFLLSFAVSFYLQRVWTFEKKENKKVPRELVLYMLNAFLSLNINGLGMHFLTNEIQIWYLVSQIIVNLGLGVLNFFIYKFIIFRKDDETNCEQE